MKIPQTKAECDKYIKEVLDPAQCPNCLILFPTLEKAVKHAKARHGMKPGEYRMKDFLPRGEE